MTFMKEYAVDVFWEYARSYVIEAESRQDAERRVTEMLRHPGFDPLKNGFEQLEDFSLRCSGEADVNGNIMYDTASP